MQEAKGGFGCSLGVVAFELWHPFSTGMERVVLLQALRERGTMPAEWEAANQQVRLAQSAPVDLWTAPALA